MNCFHRKNKNLTGIEEYISQARKRLKRALSSNSVDPVYLKALLLQVEGKCSACGNDKLVMYNECGNQQRYTFSCGHSLLCVFIEEKINISESYSMSSFGIEKGKQKISARVIGKRMKKENEEIIVAKRFCKFDDRQLETFYNDIEKSPIDVIGENKEVREFFQVTKLYSKDFWYQLNRDKEVDFLTDALVCLVDEAIKRKNCYDAAEKRKIVLLIDTWPGISSYFVEKACKELLETIMKSEFKEIWLIGSTKESSFCIWPV